jgi:hypothetical protein
MATTKYYIEFRENPQIGDFFEYELRDNYGLIEYENEETKIRINFEATNEMPNQVAVLGTLDLTLNNLLSQLNMGWNAYFENVVGQTTTVNYARVDDSIEVTIVHSAAHILQRTYMNERFFMRTETPCETFVYQTGRPVYGFDGFYTDEVIASLYDDGILFSLVKDLTLNINLTIGTVFNFHQVFRRGNAILINRISPVAKSTAVRVYPTQDYEPYFSENNLFIPFFPNQLMPENSLEFSVNDTGWQTANVFEDLEIGFYTIRVRDSFGCEKSYYRYNTGQSNITPPPDNIYISESNSIRFVKNEGNLPNVYNSFSFSESDINPFTHIFKSDEIIKTEIRASYQDLQANHGTIEKIVANIGITDSRDALFFNQNGFVAVLFESGNLYTDGVESGTYDLNGSLPEWGIVGNWVSSPYGLLQIQEIAFLDNGNEILILNSTFTIDSPTTQIITCTYNREIYDIFIHTMDMIEFTDDCFYIEIFNNENIFYRSETIQVLSEIPSMFRLIKWSNSKNTDIYYSSGIEMSAWLPISRIIELSDGDVETLKTDSRVFTIRNTNYKAIQVIIENLTRGMVRKIKLALKHDTLTINEIQYTLVESPEIENYGTSVFYRISAKLIEKGEIFNSLGNTNPFNGDVVRLLEVTNENYIKI